jgi:hypothetical protein
VLAGGRVGVVEGAGPAILQVGLALDHVGEGRRGGVLEIGHEHLRPGVQGVDDHLAVDRTGDLNPAIEEVLRDRCDGPVAFADMRRLGQEVRQFAGIEALLTLEAQRQETAACRIEAAMQVGQKLEGGRAQDLVKARGLAPHLDPGWARTRRNILRGR